MNAAARILDHAQRNMLWALLGCYLLGMAWPAWGLWIRGVELAGPGLDGQWSLIDVMLALLLFNAGLGLDLERLARFRRNAGIVAIGVSAAAAIPFAFVVVAGLASWIVPGWVGSHGLVMGLAVVAAMPAAGSSAAWSQNSEGSLSLSLGLILASTLLSPVVAGMTISVAAALVGQDVAAAPSHYATTFLALWVALPAFAGVALRARLGAARVERWATALKFTNLVNLLLLNYANASMSLPATMHRPSWSFLVLAAALCALLCALMFVAAGLLAGRLHLDRARRIALCYGMGMRNNGAGLVLVGTIFRDYPEVMLPVIFYNIIQHAAAAVLDRASRALNGRAARRP
jgi:BASS family bile acid:Na+ symporter